MQRLLLFGNESIERDSQRPIREWAVFRPVVQKSNSYQNGRWDEATVNTKHNPFSFREICTCGRGCRQLDRHYTMQYSLNANELEALDLNYHDGS